jgi:preprotein translocase subunit SecG
VTILLVIVYVIVCLFLIMVVLLQQGKGADLAGAFGGGGSQTSFGPRSGTNIMHRMTTASFVLFVVLSMALAILSGKQRSSVMEGVDTAPPPGTVEQAPGEQMLDTAEEPPPAAAAGAEEGAVEGTAPVTDEDTADSPQAQGAAEDEAPAD